jgi:glycerol kinase
MAYGTVDVLGRMRDASGVEFDRLRVDGGATHNNWLMQFQADVLGVAVERPDMVETTALGAAGLAGLGAGVWSSAEQFLSTRRFDRFVPAMRHEAAQAHIEGWRRAVRATLAWAADDGPRTRDDVAIGEG